MNFPRLLLLLPLTIGLASCDRQPPAPPPRQAQAAAPEKPCTLTYDNYRGIRVGMKEAEVRALLGQPNDISAHDTSKESSLILRWTQEMRAAGAESKKNISITVYFRNGCVTSKEADLVK